MTIAIWNCNGLFKGKLRLAVFLKAKDISVMSVSETRLKKGQSIRIRGFQIFRKDRETRGDGVAVLVRNDLQARQVDLVTPLKAIGVEVEIRGKGHRFVSLYIPLKKTYTEEEFRGLLAGPRTIIGGDFVTA